MNSHSVSAAIFALWRPTRGCCAPALALCALVAGAAPAAGASPTIETTAREAILIDFATGEVLFEKEAEKRIPPASMSKIMTTYMVFDQLKGGRMSLDDTLPVSENAWRKGGAKSGGSTMFLAPGSRARIEDLLRGVIVQSGNDASIALAEGLASSERAFAEAMTAKAKKLGLKDSHFTNATGLPDPDHYMTAHDLARLAAAIIRDFPNYQHYHAEKTFTYNGITQGNRNPLLYKDIGVDGLKTGHTQEAGYSLTVTAKRGERRLVLVVTGLSSMKDRSRESERLLDWGFREFNNYALFKAGDTVVTADVWLGNQGTIPLVIERDFLMTLPRQARKEMKVVASFDGPIPAPIAKGARVGTVSIRLPERPPIEAPLVAGANVEQLGVWGRLNAALRYVLWGENG